MGPKAKRQLTPEIPDVNQNRKRKYSCKKVPVAAGTKRKQFSIKTRSRKEDNVKCNKTERNKTVKQSASSSETEFENKSIISVRRRFNQDIKEERKLSTYSAKRKRGRPTKSPSCDADFQDVTEGAKVSGVVNGSKKIANVKQSSEILIRNKASERNRINEVPEKSISNSGLTLQIQNKNDNSKNDDSSNSESEWEEVAEGEEEEAIQDIDDYKPEIPEGGVEITLEGQNFHRKKERKAFDIMSYIRCEVNRFKKHVQLAVHQVHLLCLLARGLYVNEILNSDDIKAISLSLVPSEYTVVSSKIANVDTDYIRKLVSWFRSCFVVDANFKPLVNFKKAVSKCFHHQKASSSSEYNMMFVTTARALGFKVRLCISLYPLSFKPTDLLKKQKPKKNGSDNGDQGLEEKNSDPTTSGSISSKSVDNKGKTSKRIKTIQKKPKVYKGKDKGKHVINKPTKNVPSLTNERPKRCSLKKITYKLSSDESNGDENSDNDFQGEDSDLSSDEQIKPGSTKRISHCFSDRRTKEPKNRKILSSDSSLEQDRKEKQGIECWAEIYSKYEKKWISVECFNNIINKPYEIENNATQPVSYVLAFDNLSYVKDVTKRYCSRWMTFTRKLRVEPDWWQETIEPFLPPSTEQDRDEDSKMEAMLLCKPIPSSIAELKNHPLYVLKRHLLKFEALYPPDVPSVGFIRGEPVYARECVHKLHSRETWLKEARLVRIGEEPYKIVKARPKWDKMTGTYKTDLPLNLYGRWQTEEYMPPIAWNGKVPRNEYGNVELFKPCMLPVGTVHLRNPGLNRVANKLGIDCSPAVVGFDGHRGSIHPVFDGFVVCEEFKDTLLAAWEEEQENIRKREEEKREKRVYGNWKKLIKGLLIREKIRLKYCVK